MAINRQISFGTPPSDRRRGVAARGAAASPGGTLSSAVVLGIEHLPAGDLQPRDPCEYPDFKEPHFPAPVLNSDVLDDAYVDALPGEWPPFQELSFAETWNWLHEDMIYDLDIAETPAQKALFGLLRICTREQWDPNNSLILAQALESLVASGKGDRIHRRVVRRLEELFGPRPPGDQWFRDFYQLRSRIIHGSAPMLRPGPYYDKSDRRVRREVEHAAELEGIAVAAMLALLQRLVATGTHEFDFD
ncbi:hypothetical protein BH20GEM2_BH20GEM2_12250 [soil metagenome]